jgi:parvulin-like peptidyl-prolyl isomerase
MRAAPLWIGPLLALAAGTASAEKKPGWVQVDRIAAVVNQDVILTSELARRVAGMSPGPDKPPPPGAERQILETMIDETLFTQEAARARITVSDPEVDGAIQEIKKSNRLDDAGLVKALAAQGYTMELYREDVRLQILRLRAMNVIIRPRVNVRDDEVLAAYKDAKKADPTLAAFDKVKDRLGQQMFEQRMANETQKWLLQRRLSSYIAVRGS